MSILNVDKIQPIGGGSTITVSATDIQATSATITAASLVIPEYITHTGDTNTKFGFPAADTYSVETAGSERLRITDTGALLLGTTTVSNVENFRIHTASSNKAIMKFTNTGTGTGSGSGLEFGLNSNEDAELVLKEDKNILFFTGNTNTEKLRITSTGVVSINDTTPETFATLQVKNHTGANAAQFLLHGADMAQIILRDETGGSNAKCTTIRNDQGALLIGTHNDSYGGFSEKLRIASTGDATFTENVTIVKSSGPILELTTNTSAADATLRLSEGATGGINNGGGMYYSGADNKLYITCGTNSTTKRISINRDDGRIGIGSEIPNSKLEVWNGSNIEVLRLKDTHFNKFLTIRGGGSPNRMVIDSYEGGGGGADIDFASNGSTKVRIKSTGQVAIGTDTAETGYILSMHGDLSLGEKAGTDNTFIDQKQDGDLHLINSGRTAHGGSGSGGAGGVGVNKFNTIAGGTSLFRDFCVFNGKNSKVLVVDGSASSVGIGEDAPSEKLDVNGTIQCLNELRSRTGNDLLLNAGSANRDVKIQVNDVNMLYVKGDTGKIGMGIDNPYLNKVCIKNDVSAGTHNWALHLLNGTHASDSRIGLAFQANNNAASNTWDGAGIYAANDGSTGKCHTMFGTVIDGGFTETMRIKADGNIGMGIASPTQESGRGLHIRGATGGQTRLHLTTSDSGDATTDGFYIIVQGAESGGSSGEVMLQQKENKALKFATNNTERLRIVAGGDVTTTGANFDRNNAGCTMRSGDAFNTTRNGGTPLEVNRGSNDGALVNWFQANSHEGSVTVSGSSVNYGGGVLSRWSQLVGISTNVKSDRPTIYQGTVMSNLDEMCEWPGEENMQLNKTQVSTASGDKNVAGVFWAWDDDDDVYTNDFWVAQTGDFIVRVAANTTVTRGDLLESAGDGTAKPQSDDIVRSKTVGKISSGIAHTTYADGTKAYPCVLMAC